MQRHSDAPKRFRHEHKHRQTNRSGASCCAGCSPASGPPKNGTRTQLCWRNRRRAPIVTQWDVSSTSVLDGAGLEYTPDRKGEHCRALLSTFVGWLHADGYAGFGRLYEIAGAPKPALAPLGPPRVAEVTCWAHARRGFFDVHKANGSPTAKQALVTIGALFDIERLIAGQSAAHRQAVRQRNARPRIDELAVWLDAQLQLIPGKSALAGAIRYARWRWDAGRSDRRRARAVDRRGRARCRTSSSRHRSCASRPGPGLSARVTPGRPLRSFLPACVSGQLAFCPLNGGNEELVGAFGGPRGGWPARVSSSVLQANSTRFCSTRALIYASRSSTSRLKSRLSSETRGSCTIPRLNQVSW